MFSDCLHQTFFCFKNVIFSSLHFTVDEAKHILTMDRSFHFRFFFWCHIPQIIPTVCFSPSFVTVPIDSHSSGACMYCIFFHFISMPHSYVDVSYFLMCATRHPFSPRVTCHLSFHSPQPNISIMDMSDHVSVLLCPSPFLPYRLLM